MLQFPETTYIGKRIPKEGFYNKLDMSVSLKKAFIDDIEQIIWKNLFSDATLNVGKGEKVTQIDVIQLNLKRQVYSKSILDVIEKAIPRHLLFVLKFTEQYQLHMNYKDEYQKGKFRIVESYSTNWLTENEISLTLKGLNLDQVYENLVYQLAGTQVDKTEGVDLKQTILQAQETDKIKKKVAELEVKLRNERQFNIQLKISNEIRELKKILLTDLNNSNFQ